MLGPEDDGICPSIVVDAEPYLEQVGSDWKGSDRGRLVCCHQKAGMWMKMDKRAAVCALELWEHGWWWLLCLDLFAIL
jgi:hypothetical protein